jgi:DNA-nicking Smr family endonuclease
MNFKDHETKKYNDFLFSDAFLKNRSSDIESLKRKFNNIDFEKKEKYKNSWSLKLFDDFESNEEFIAHLDKKNQINFLKINREYNSNNQFYNSLNKDIVRIKERDLPSKSNEYRKRKNFDEIKINENQKSVNQNIIKKINSGEIEIDHIIDLHNMKINDAHSFFLKEIFNSYREHKKFILLITGIGYGSGVMKSDKYNANLYSNKNIIKNNIIDWINGNNILFQICLYITHASKKHGGQGAFYIYLR